MFAFRKPVEVSLAVARPIQFLYRLMAWAIGGLNGSARVLLWLFGQRDTATPSGGHFSISEEELRIILQASEQEGVLKPDETKMIHGVFDLYEQTPRDLMVPRTEVVGIPREATLGDAIAIFRKSKHSRFPVFDETIDRIDGVLFIKEMLDGVDPGDPSSLDRPVSELMQPAYIVPGTKPVHLLLNQFKTKRQQMAIVADEYGGTAGLVTLEDILEEIVGEFDDEASRVKQFIKKQTDDGRIFVDPNVRLDDLGGMIDYSFEAAEYNTLAGLIYFNLGHVAEVGDRVELPDLRIVVEATAGHRLVDVSLMKTESENSNAGGSESSPDADAV